jgi:predicted dehydrogenase
MTMKIAMITLDHVHAESYLHDLLRRPGLEVLLYVTDDAERVREGLRRPDVDVPAVTESLDEVRAWGPDGVVLVSETAEHERFLSWAAASGIRYVLCEKPLAATQAQCERIVALSMSAGLEVMLAYPVRFSPSWRSVRSAVLAGAIGDVIAVHGVNDGTLPTGLRPWFAEPTRSGGGALIDHTVHIADLIDDLSDGSPVASVTASANNAALPGLVDVETAGVASVHYEDGVVATIQFGWTHPHGHATWGGLRLTIVGTKGIVDFDAFPREITVIERESGREKWLPGGVDLDALMLDAYLDAVRTGRPVAPSVHSGARSARVASLGYSSLSQPGSTPEDSRREVEADTFG